MTALNTPSLELRFVRSVADEALATPVEQWPAETVSLCLETLQSLKQGAARMQASLDKILTDGVESRRFAEYYRAMLPTVEEYVLRIHELLAALSAAEDPQSQKLAASVQDLERSAQKYLDGLKEAMALATAPPRPLDPERARTAQDAFTRGESKLLSRP